MNNIDLFKKALEKKDLNKEINAIIYWNEKIFDEIERYLKKDMMPFPVAIKDIIDVANMRITMGSRLFQDRIAEKDAEVVRRLKEWGGVVIGITNTHEFASGVTTTSSIYGPTRNPVDKRRIAGGSSGGSAAAVAADIVPVALGTDTAGSVRIPASLTGVYGFRPTYGVISLEGVFPLAPSLDTVGVLAKDLYWLEYVFKIIVREKDLHVMRRILRKKIRKEKLKFGVPRWFRAIDEVMNEFYNKISKLDYEEISMEDVDKKLLKYFPIIRLTEATNVHIKYRDKWSLYFPDVQRLLMKGLEIKAYEYVEASKIRDEMYMEMRRLMKRHKIDLWILPTTPVYAPLIEDVLGREDVVRDVLASPNVTYPSFLRLPAISIPSITVGNLPVGIEIFGDKYEDLFIIYVSKTLKEEKIF